MMRFDETLLCDGCGVEISWAPYTVGEKTYCCKDCYKIGVCDCRNRQDDDDERRGNEVSIDSPASPYAL